MKSVTKSWKTSLGGVLSTLGVLLSAGDDWYKVIGVALTAVGMSLLGLSARDSDVSSESAGAK